MGQLKLGVSSYRIVGEDMSEVIVVTTPEIPGYEIVKVIGPVHGLTVRTRGVSGKIVASIEGIFGGEVTSYTSECEKAGWSLWQGLLKTPEKWVQTPL